MRGLQATNARIKCYNYSTFPKRQLEVSSIPRTLSTLVCVFVTYTINKAVAFIEINREMCGDRARTGWEKRRAEKACAEAKNETLTIMHSEMWEDSSNPVKES